VSKRNSTPCSAIHALVIDPAELLDRFPADAMTPELMQRAQTLGLVELTADGNVRVSDRRFLETGSALARLGIPLGVILDEWETLIGHTDEIAEQFIELFEQYLAPSDWRSDLDINQARALASTLAHLQATARQVLAAALDDSVAGSTRAPRPTDRSRLTEARAPSPVSAAAPHPAGTMCR
jgi:hypothetical protein